MAVRCAVCGEDLETEAGLGAHHHERPASWEVSGARFSCPSCGAAFDGEEDLVAHEAMEHTARARRGKGDGSQVRPGEPLDRRPPRQWPRG